MTAGSGTFPKQHHHLPRQTIHQIVAQNDEVEEALADEQLKRRLAHGSGAHKQSNISRHSEIPKRDPPEGAPRETKRSNKHHGRPEPNQSAANLRTLSPPPLMARIDAECLDTGFSHALQGSANFVCKRTSNPRRTLEQDLSNVTG